MTHINTASGQGLPAGKSGRQEQGSSSARKRTEYRRNRNGTQTRASGAFDRGSVASSSYDLRLYMALAGAALLVIGTFLPVFTVSDGFESESVNYYGTGCGDAWLILVFAVVAVVQALARRYKGPTFAGVATLALMIWEMISLSVGSSKWSDLGVSLGIGWGWLVLIPGVILLIWSRWAPHQDRAQS